MDSISDYSPITPTISSPEAPVSFDAAREIASFHVRSENVPS
jgi:hypothetical protein